jgi:hypothetical protein
VHRIAGNTNPERTQERNNVITITPNKGTKKENSNALDVGGGATVQFLLLLRLAYGRGIKASALVRSNHVDSIVAIEETGSFLERAVLGCSDKVQ